MNIIIPLAFVWWSHPSTVILFHKMFSFSGLSNQFAVFPALYHTPSYKARSNAASLSPLNVMSFIFSSATTTFWLHKDPWQHKEQAIALKVIK